FRRHARGAFGVELRALPSHETAQGFNVIGKRGSVVWHTKLVSARKTKRFNAFFNPQVGDARTGARQSMPSSSIASSAADRDTVPVAAIGQMKRPFSRRLANKHRP